MYRNQTQCRSNNLHRRNSLFPLLFVAALLAFCDFGFCESQASFAFNWIVPIPHPLTSLLRAEQVRRELSMATDQIDDVERAIEDAELPLWRLRDLPHQKRNEQAGLLIRQLRKELSQILSARQIERLNQLTWQAIGIAAVLEPEVALKLNLSDEQINKVRISLNASYDKLAVLHRNMEIGSESLRISYINKLREKTEKNVLSVLNSYQQNILQQLMGRPFDLSQVRIVACKAPEFEVDTWINKPKVNLSELSGKVTVIHFYAFGCGNCIRTLPYYNQWRDHFPSSVFQIVGIHRPETEQERDIEKVKKKAAEAGMEYPVAIDNDSLMWNAWANCIWPSIYLLDKNGYVRYWWYGELNWQGAESEKYLRSKIQELIEESSILSE
jgi:thiol-disulfide isomerase/thioredoxin